MSSSEPSESVADTQPSRPQIPVSDLSLKEQSSILNYPRGVRLDVYDESPDEIDIREIVNSDYSDRGEKVKSLVVTLYKRLDMYQKFYREESCKVRDLLGVMESENKSRAILKRDKVIGELLRLISYMGYKPGNKRVMRDLNYTLEEMRSEGIDTHGE